VIAALVLIPFLAALLAFFMRPPNPRRALLVLTAILHALLTAAAWFRPPAPGWQGILDLDALGLLFLSMTSVLFLAAAIYAVAYLARESPGRREDFEEGFLFINAPEAVFTGCLLLFLASMTLVTVSGHFGLQWVGIEATTLASAPLIYFHRHHRSLEATWKYLMVCSVGIGLALLGNFFLAVAVMKADGTSTPLILRDLLGGSATLQLPWLKLAFLLLLVGYGTKMGLAPLHTWLPDAHSEAPSVVSALLSGALLNCAFLGILRAFQVCAASGLADYARGLLTVFGLMSMAFAAAFVVGQVDYKRLLAYSSVEHVGVLALGVGLGGSAAFGAMLHAVNHSLGKAALFLVAGNILAAYRTKSAAQVRGLLLRLPASGVLWVAGFFVITGTPPSGIFLSELTILNGALTQGRFVVAILYLLFLGIIFVGMGSAMLSMAGTGDPDSSASPRKGESWFAIAPPAALGILAILLGVYVPAWLSSLLLEAARALGGSG